MKVEKEKSIIFCFNWSEIDPTGMSLLPCLYVKGQETFLYICETSEWVVQRELSSSKKQ